ncbi:MAG: hypothetical protein IH604_13140 [Burkholderiales bacterium]|nr:hypothetical protein [Burkholderiales bacterium]
MQRVIDRSGLSVFAAGALLAAGIAAAAGGDLTEAQLRYKQDRAACLGKQPDQDRAACLREAGAALQEAKRGRLTDENGAYEQNRLSRCERLPADDRADCVRRMHGEGTVSGSVESGGTFRELRTTVPAK